MTISARTCKLKNRTREWHGWRWSVLESQDLQAENHSITELLLHFAGITLTAQRRSGAVRSGNDGFAISTGRRLQMDRQGSDSGAVVQLSIPLHTALSVCVDFRELSTRDAISASAAFDGSGGAVCLSTFEAWTTGQV